MLIPAFLVLAAAMLLGTLLAILHLRGGAMPSWYAGALHGALGACGFAVLVVALGAPARSRATGTASFGVLAAVFFAIALLSGVGLLIQRFRKRPLPGVLIGAHATIAIGALVILSAYLVLP
jgi:hypothetical protein